MLDRLREDLKAGRFVPERVREKVIPKTSGKVRRLGIPTTVDRVVQAALKLVLEPIFEADFKPCSYGFRPRRRAQDAIAEIHHLASPNRNYEWVFEADIKACFDEIDHTALLGRVRHRVGDKRVLSWVKAFLRAGILTEEGLNRETNTGTPQGGLCAAAHKPPYEQRWVCVAFGVCRRWRRWRRPNATHNPGEFWSHGSARCRAFVIGGQLSWWLCPSWCPSWMPSWCV
jgi:hypothetical protein